jgi:hypothetical protein
LLKRRILGPRLSVIIAVQEITASFASSDGWNEVAKSQRRDPCTRGAMSVVHGRMMTVMSTSDVIMHGHAQRSQRAASILAAAAKSTAPTATPEICFRKK